MTEIPFRMLEGRGLDLGTVTIRDGHLPGHTGFDGYFFGFVDENGDGINDRFIDANGDGIDDQTGYPYCQGFGWADANGDGMNDAFTDTNGDGVNDWTGYHYDMGYHMEPGFQGGHMGGGIDWPIHGGGMMM